MGAAVDAALKEKLCVTIIAAKQNVQPSSVTPRAETRTGTTPLPGQREPALSRVRGLRKNPKAVQTQLPLSIVSKGRFDKSEPTKHNGEDLDVPTFLRRGIPLN